MVFLDYYQFLSISDQQGVTCKEVKQAYRKKAIDLHPDKLTDPEQISQAPALISYLEQARETLCDPCKKKEYDNELSKHIVNNSATDTPDLNKDNEINNSKAPEFDKFSSDLIQALSKLFSEFSKKSEDNNKSFDPDGSKPENFNDQNDKAFDPDAPKPENFNDQNEFHKHINGNTFLHIAILSNLTNMAKDLILSCSKDKETDNILGYKPLHYAAMLGQLEIVDLLMQYGAKISINHYKESPLENALQNKHVTVANIILERVDISEFDINTIQELSKAACENNASSECKELYSKLGLENSHDIDLSVILGSESNDSADY